MNFAMIRVDEFDDLDAFEISALVALRSFGEKVFPSHASLAKRAGMSVSKLQRVLNSLRDKGRIMWAAVTGTSNKYLVRDLPTSVPQTDPLGTTDRPPSVRGTDEEENLKQRRETKNNPSDPAGRREERQVLGEIPEDDPPVVEHVGFPLTHAGTVAYFRNEARKQGMDGDVPRVNAAVKKMNKGMGLSYDQIQGIIRFFFSKYDVQISSKRNEFTAISMFQQMLQRLVNQNPRPITEKSTYEKLQAQYDLTDEIKRWSEERKHG